MIDRCVAASSAGSREIGVSWDPCDYHTPIGTARPVVPGELMPDFDIQKRIEEINRLRTEGVLETDIAAKLGITLFTLSRFCRKYVVQRILTGHSLAHVTEAV